jgi:hypothetical protein
MKSLCTRILKYLRTLQARPAIFQELKTKTIQVSEPRVQIPDNRVWWVSRALEDLLFLTAADIIPVAMNLSGML